MVSLTFDDELSDHLFLSFSRDSDRSLTVPLPNYTFVSHDLSFGNVVGNYFGF